MAKQEKQSNKRAPHKSRTAAGQQASNAGGRTQNKKSDVEFPLGKENFILMAIGFAIIVLGYILMAGDENIYSFQKITLSVLVVMFGYAFEIYAIMKTPKSQQTKDET